MRQLLKPDKVIKKNMRQLLKPDKVIKKNMRLACSISAEQTYQQHKNLYKLSALSVVVSLLIR